MSKQKKKYIFLTLFILFIISGLFWLGIFIFGEKENFKAWLSGRFGTSADIELEQPDLEKASFDIQSFNDDTKKYIFPAPDSVEAMVEIIPGKSNFDLQEEERLKQEEEERKKREEEERKKRLEAMETLGAGLCSDTQTRYVEIDLSSQRLALCNMGNNEGTYPISSGSRQYPTPTGSYKINSKSLRAYSSKYNLYMPYWNSFIGNSYGIHELPEYPNGYKEGANLLGQAVSHGCVRLGVGPAAFLYSWAPVGTAVVVHN